jgi:hypothetical protein
MGRSSDAVPCATPYGVSRVQSTPLPDKGEIMETTALDRRTAESVGAEFLDALARRDWANVRSLLDPRISFRVLTPRALREADDDAGAVAWLTRWFGDADELTTLCAEVSTMHDRLSIDFRFHLHKDRWYVIEQRGYVDVIDGKITDLALICSEFRCAA